jgi:hypothetical protein
MSVLDDMTKGITEAKALKSTKLTPVGVESEPTKPSLAGRHNAPFPYDDSDMTQGAIRDGLKVLTQLYAHLDFVKAGLEALAETYGMTAIAPTIMPKRADPTDRPVIGGTGKDPEKDGGTTAVSSESAIFSESAGSEADKFAASFADKQRRAQADAFAAADDEAPDTYLAPALVESGWECPVHGATNLVVLTSKRTQRKYRSCTVTGCMNFEK